MRIKIFVFTFFLLSVPVAAIANVSERTLQTIQAIIDKDRTAYQIPAVQVSIIFPGEHTPHDFVSGTTTLQGAVPITTKNLLQIGNETKSFTAATLLLLEAAGKLSLDDPLVKWLPGLPAAWQTLTVREILNQSSRLYNFTDASNFVAELQTSGFQKNWTSPELLAFAFNQPRCDKWCYSNTNYILAGMVIEAVTGDAVTQVMQHYLFEPLQLENTYYAPVSNAFLLARMAHGYSKKNNFPLEPKDITDLNLSWGKTAGAIISNSHDTAIWLKNLVNGRLLPKQQLTELMTTVSEQDPEETSNYGLGLEQDFDSFQQESWEHNGGTLGYSSWMVWLKDSDIVITIIISDATVDRADINALLVDIAKQLDVG